MSVNRIEQHRTKNGMPKYHLYTACPRFAVFCPMWLETILQPEANRESKPCFCL